MSLRNSRGYTLVELVVVVAIIGILASLAVPATRRQIQQVRVRSALDRVAGEIYRTRMLAVASGRTARLALQTDDGGCVRGMRVTSEPAPDEGASLPALELPGLCLRHSGDSIFSFNSRGILRPPARSLHAAYGAAADSLLLSIAGRVRRTY